MSTNRNRYPANCVTCARRVRAGGGALVGKSYTGSKGWRTLVQCDDCADIPPQYGFVALDDAAAREAIRAESAHMSPWR